KQDTVGPVPKPLRLHGQIPAPLLLIQPTQQQIHVPMVFPVRVDFVPCARAAPAFMDSLSWHTSSVHRPQECPHSTPSDHLTGSPQNPEVVFLHALSLSGLSRHPDRAIRRLG